MIMIIFTTGTVKAAQSTKVEDVIQYISSVHKIKGKDYQLSQHNAARIATYLEDNRSNVMENGHTIDENSEKILANLKEAERIINASPAKKLSEVPAETVNQIKDLIIEAGKLAEITVTIDTTKLSDEIVTAQLKFKDEIISLSYVGENSTEKPGDIDKPNQGDNDNNNNNNNGNNNNNSNSNNNNNKPTDGNNNNNQSSSTKNDTSTTTNNHVNTTTTTQKLVYTGKDYSVIIKSIVAIVAIAIAGVIIVKKHEK